MTISQFVNVLLDCCKATYHREAFQEQTEFIVWSEVGYRALYADNVRVEEPKIIAVDVLTKHEFSEVPARFQRNMKEYEITYKGPEIIFNPDSGFTQYAYTVELI